MMHRLVPAIAGLFVVTGTLAAQEEANRHQRGGFYFAVGLGAGSAGVECVPCGGSIDRESGFSGTLRLGGTVSPTVQLGVTTNGWFKEESGLKSSLGFINFAVTLYPSSRGGFFFQLGVGGMGGSIADGAGNEVTTVGPGALVGLGYDIRVGSNISLTLYANAMAARGNLRVNGVEVLNENFNPNLTQIGVALTIH